MNNFLSVFPDPDALIRQFPVQDIREVNAHLHTPFSFSAFEDISQIFDMAVQEKIAVAGINDFFVADGYDAFCSEALKTGVFPLFNIEFISLLKEEQQQHIRINDPNNPGRCYFSGKGLDFPFMADKQIMLKLSHVVDESQEQVRAMIALANSWFESIGAEIHLDYSGIRRHLARELVRERHIAKAIRMAVFENCTDPSERKSLLTLLFDGKEPKAPMHDIAQIENEIRSNLLKAGGKAFVEEDDNAFMQLPEVLEIILAAGGIPCYPVLLDDQKGNYTEYEKDPEALYKELSRHHIRCIELIPGRNAAGPFESFIRYFDSKGFIILLGTEHNSPGLIPLTCNTRGGIPLSEYALRISWEGACAVAAHQYLRARGQQGAAYPMTGSEKTRMIELGNAVIHHYLNQYKP
jgi:hypothetical protein